MFYFLSHTHMKKFKLFSILGIALLSCTLLAGCNDNNGGLEVIEIDNSDVIAYNDALVDIASQCYDAEEAIWTAYEAEDGEAMQSAVDSTISACQNTIEQLQSVEAWEEDSSLKDAIIPVIEKEIEYCDNFHGLVEFLWADLDNLSEEDATRYEAVVAQFDTILSEIDEVNNDLASVQETFAANHGYELEVEEEVVVE